ncbi:TIGR04282 family arsenosugar biosynthesis glycosyltransferase [Williamsia sterculiae]|uniref:Glycosyltransferase involved in cell wall biogenesis n=1 Tax=Williamsia sterculiae TaxID=1344003 RepID=A0A1N7CFU3_9NOCA|nr:DUF2064 domain-containing protein [Williamsia sterculiae]SIR62347.1 hypothetical protein SAMN05445060_0102 [Williamsia sterculiae]
MTAAVLLVAKAPVAGVAKTRLMSRFTPEQAADIAAAALVDTLDTALVAAAERADTQVVVALTGDLNRAARHDDLTARLARTVVIDQRGDAFGERLLYAHRDAADAVDRGAVMQIGMDTPQLTTAALWSGLDALDDHDVALGPAADGGWWGLAVSDARGSEVLPSVPMSQADTGARTLQALRDAGLSVALLDSYADVDTPDDVATVASMCLPSSAFGRFAGASVR